MTGQLAVTGMQVCHFVVWTDVDITVVPIERDQIFIDYMLSKLQQCYTDYFKPAVLRTYLYKEYEKYGFKNKHA